MGELFLYILRCYICRLLTDSRLGVFVFDVVYYNKNMTLFFGISIFLARYLKISGYFIVIILYFGFDILDINCDVGKDVI